MGKLCPRTEVIDLVKTAALTQLGFREAATAWLESRRYHLSPRTFSDYSNYIRTLSAFFGEMRVAEIDSDQVRAYQHARSLRAGFGLINKELGVVMMIRRRIGIPLNDYQRLREPKDYESPGRRLSKEEETRLEKVFREAAEVKRWAVGALASMLSMKSGCGPGEIRSLRLKDCSLDPPQVVIPPRGAKNKTRQRIVPLNDAATWALEKLIDRAMTTCGAGDPEHYLIPFQNRNRTFDPTKPCSTDGWRTALNHLLGLADVNVRRYDFRHHAVSVALADRRVTREGAKAYFGWISEKMFRRYGHQELAALRVVAAAMDRKPPQSSVDNLRNRLRTRAQNNP